jgi:hypothetical protein
VVQWCKEASEHIVVVVVSVLPGALKTHKLLESFAEKATVASLHTMLLQNEGDNAAVAVLQKANASCANSMNAAVAAATADKFIFSIWEGGFIIAHRILVNAIRWVEWDAGPSATRFGSLTFSLNPDRMQQQSILETMCGQNLPGGSKLMPPC